MGTDGMEVSISRYLNEIEKATAALEQADVVGRIWQKDHTVWQPEPAEITNRLGWLDVIDSMTAEAATLTSFAGEIKRAGFRHIVLLGMGGSSLAPEVFRQTFGRIKGYPELIVLDSTVPAVIQEVTGAIEMSGILFLVASKSGNTLETGALYGYFREMVTAAVGQELAGDHFVAITDPGTSLAEKAVAAGFRRSFLNPPDMGGRYAALSYVGLVPAALMGIDIGALLSRASEMHRDCLPGGPLSRNPGAWLGVILGSLARQSRDKLTLLISPELAGFGLWVEQLVAESTGKKGQGIVPVIGEPVMSPEYYGNDRYFVYVRLDGDNNTENDAAIGQLAKAGYPTVTINLSDRYDLGAEFFRWELATAVAGAMLKVNPFYQPDVEATKRATLELLHTSSDDSNSFHSDDIAAFGDLLAKTGEGSYLAILVYLPPTAGLTDELTELRRRVLEKYHITTTLGYGPRYLHSTGQLHKGGPDRCSFLQLTAEHTDDFSIPGSNYTFGRLVNTQAAADRQTLLDLARNVVSLHLAAPEDIVKIVNYI
jgi:glucose-6-phosphate isomerase/transaldolase/glucose-6-phosphate isomerase